MNIDERLEALTRNLGLAHRGIQELRESIQELRESQREGFAELRCDSEGLHGSIKMLAHIAGVHDSRLDEHEQPMDDHQRRLDNLEQKPDSQ